MSSLSSADSQLVLNPAPNPPPNPVVFSLAPALVNKADLIDYRTTYGAKLYATATKALDLSEPDTLKPFLTQLRTKASIMAWGDILNVPKNVRDLHNDLCDISVNCGERSITEIREHVRLYIQDQNREAQDSEQLYHCLLNSLSSKGLLKIAVWEEDYTIAGTISGTLLLKVIIH